MLWCSTGPLVFVIEFKTGDSLIDRAALDQVWDYALDLKNFHKGSHSVSIIPIAVATEATESQALDLHVDDDQVFRPISVAANRLRELIDLLRKSVSGDEIDGGSWPSAPLLPYTHHRGSRAGTLHAPFGRSHCTP